MTNDRKPLPEDDFVGNAAPFVLKITLEYPPRETESLLGFMPKEGKNFYDFEKFPDKRFYGNIERAFGASILNMLGGAVNDYANGVKMYRPDLLPVHTYGDCKTGFTIELEFIVVVEYHFDESENIEPSKVREDLKNVLRKGFRSDWMID